MTYNTNSGYVNKNVLINDLGLTQDRNTVFFENNDFIVLSPSIQNESWWFDLLRGNVEKVQNSSKDGLLVLRFLDKLLVTPLQKFIKTMIDERFVVKRQQGQDNWKFNIRLKGEKYIVINQKNSKVEYPIQEVTAEGLVELANRKIWLNDGNMIVREEVQVMNKEVKETLLELPSNNLIPHIHNYIASKGFNYSLANITNLYLSLRSKPFVIISGISGTGKTKIVQLFAESIRATEDNDQFTLIPVRPNWSDGSELLGYIDIKGDFIEGPLTKVVREANENQDRPYFVLLDEMNLARVEYYFSDVLSIMESRKKDGNTYTSSTLIEIKDKDTEEVEKLTLPNNLYIIGTVNMDETTHPFSKKVLDRANTIEFNEIDLMNFSFLEEKENVKPIQLANSSIEASYIQLQDCYKSNEEIVQYVSSGLATINKMIEPLNAHVGYRVRDEICFYMIYNNEGSLFKTDEALDYCIMQKILPRIAGSGQKIRNVLEALFEQFSGVSYDQNRFDGSTVKYPQSAKKVHDMLGRLGDEGFTSFWIS